MVRALLDGRKTQTRRVLKRQDWPEAIVRQFPRQKADVPYAVGDRLWVREAWTHDADSIEALRAAVEDVYWDGSYGPYYRATEVAPETMRWRSPIHMPRWASRLTLIVTDVRVERLNDISEADARAEGVHPIIDHGVGNQHLHRIAFEHLWNSLHDADIWAANPWVVAVTFTVHRANIDTPTSPDALAETTEGARHGPCAPTLPPAPVGAGRAS